MSGPIAASIAACNAGDRSAWLQCYNADVEWVIVADRTLRGIGEVASLWEAMVQGTAARSLKAQGAAVDAAGRSWRAAVVGHDGGLDTIVCCLLDSAGRILAARSYRGGRRDRSLVPAAMLTPGGRVELAVVHAGRGAAWVRRGDAGGADVVVEWDGDEVLTRAVIEDG